MNTEQQKQFDQFEEYFRTQNVNAFLDVNNSGYGLPEAEGHFRDLIYWIKRFLKNRKYIAGLPTQQVAVILNSLNDTQRTIKNIENTRESDPTNFKANKDSFIQDLEQRYGELYQSLINPLRSYLALERGGLADISRSAEESLEDIHQNKEAISEATGETAASENAKYYSELAYEFSQAKQRWVWGFGIYLLAWTLLFLLVYTKSETLRNSFKDFDLANTPAYILKIVIIAIFAYGLNFIARNYNARLMLEIAAKTRATRLKTWRAFISSPEINSSEPEILHMKAEVVLEIAKVLFSDMPSGLDKGKSRIFEAPVSITNKKA